VPIVADPSRPDGRRLVTSDGTPVARAAALGARPRDDRRPARPQPRRHDGNLAVRLYDALGFERVLTSLSVDLDRGALRS
jgi:hypothetical protein